MINRQNLTWMSSKSKGKFGSKLESTCDFITEFGASECCKPNVWPNSCRATWNKRFFDQFSASSKWTNEQCEHEFVGEDACAISPFSPSNGYRQ